MKNLIEFEVCVANEENEANNDNPSQNENKQYTHLPGITEQTSTNTFHGITQNTDRGLRPFHNVN